MPEISVLMSSYNHERYIAEAIESVLSQTLTDLELVIVDDASTDNSQDIIKQYQKKDDRIRAHFRKTNAKYVANAALDMARGKYITFCDSDDLYVADKLEKQLTAIREKGNEDKVIIADGVTINDNGTVIGPLFLGKDYEWSLEKKTNGDIFNELLVAGGLYFFRHTMLIRREYVSDIRFDKRLTWLSEYKFVLELAYRYQFHRMNDIVYKRRLHDNNDSSGWDKAVADQDRGLIAKDFLKAPYIRRISQETHVDLLFHLICVAKAREDFQEVRRYFEEVIPIHPPLSEMIRNHLVRKGSLSSLKITLNSIGSKPITLKGSDLVGLQTGQLSAQI